MKPHYFFFNFNGYTISISISGEENEELLKKAQILAQAEAIKKKINYATFICKELTNIEFCVLTAHTKLCVE